VPPLAVPIPSLSYPLSEFSVPVLPHVSASIEAAKPSSHAAWNWSLVNLDLGEVYVGAVIVEGSSRAVNHRGLETRLVIVVTVGGMQCYVRHLNVLHEGADGQTSVRRK